MRYNRFRITKQLKHMDVPPHDEFRDRLFNELAETYSTQPTTSPTSMHYTLWKWLAVPISAAAVITIGIFGITKLNHQNPAVPTFNFIPTAFASSLKDTFGMTQDGDFRFRRFVLTRTNYPNQEEMREVWVDPTHYRIDHYMQGQMFSNQHSQITREDCYANFSLNPDMHSKADAIQLSVRRRPSCETKGISSANVNEAIALSVKPMAADSTVDILITLPDPKEDTDGIIYGYKDEVATLNYFTTDNAELVTHNAEGYTYKITAQQPGMVAPKASSDPYAVWTAQYKHRDQFSPVYELNIIDGTIKIVEVNTDYTQATSEDTLDYFTRYLKGDATKLINIETPISTKPTTFHNQPAVALQFTAKDAEEAGTVYEFTVLTNNQRVVSMSQLNGETKLMTIAVDEDTVITDTQPETFFSESYWKNDLSGEALDRHMAEFVSHIR